MEDALTVMKAYDIPVTDQFYMFRLRQLVHKDQVLFSWVVSYMYCICID